MQQLTCSCIVARRASTLEAVKAECVALGLDSDRVLVVPANVTQPADLLRVRDEVAKGEFQPSVS